jgi:glycerol-3-phosphate dehydrogenase
MSEKMFDFSVIGAGVVGAAIARELTKYTNSVVVIDALDDVGAGTSKANTAILHTGFDMKPGTLESKLVSEGYKLLLEYSRKSNISIEETGALLVAWNQAEHEELANIQEKAVENGYVKTKIIDAEEVYKLEPEFGIRCNRWITCPR